VDWSNLDPEVIPNLDNLVTDDGAPVDNLFVEKQYRLLTEPLYSSWPGPGEGRSFLVMTDVGLFHTYRQPPLVPDALLSVDVAVGDLRLKENRSYFLWLLGKPPDVVLEIISDTRGGEEDYKMRQYARIGVLYYVLFDPQDVLGRGVLRAFVLQRRSYEPTDPAWFPEVGLGLQLWTGAYEGQEQTWLRWCGQDGRVIPTGAERAAAAEERQRRLEAQLRALGAEPEV
jgi:hypothetical protein